MRILYILLIYENYLYVQWIKNKKQKKKTVIWVKDSIELGIQYIFFFVIFFFFFCKERKSRKLI